MRTRLAPVLLGLAVTLSLLTGAVVQGMAQAAGARGGLQEVVICSDGIEAVVVLDANGKPSDLPASCEYLPCADCLTKTPADLSAAPAAAPPAPSAAPARAMAADLLPSPQPARKAARGPPAGV